MTDLIQVTRVDDPLIPWSFSKMQTYETCPRQYEAKYVLKSVKYVQNESAVWGDYVHKCLENYLKNGTPLPTNVAHYQKFADALRARWPNSTILPERQLALNSYLMETGYFDGDVWVRAKIDVTILDGNEAAVFDWKTGKVKDDPKQLMFYALLVFCLYPDIQRVRSAFVWLKDEFMSPPATFHRSQFEQMLGMWVGKYNKLVEAHKLGVFPPKPSGLCKGWCEVDTCEHWKPKQRRY